jgi:hypothetical protein
VAVGAVALARSDVVAHLATEGRLAGRSAVRARGRSAEATLCGRREAALRSRSAEAAAHARRSGRGPADIAELVRRLRDRAALRTGIHRSLVSRGRPRSGMAGGRVIGAGSSDAPGQHIGERRKCRIRGPDGGFCGPEARLSVPDGPSDRSDWRPARPR